MFDEVELTCLVLSPSVEVETHSFGNKRKTIVFSTDERLRVPMYQICTDLFSSRGQELKRELLPDYTYGSI